MSLVVPTAAQLESVSGMITGYLSLMRMRLFISSITIDAATTLASLLAAEATFAGYSPAALSTWSTPITEGDGSAGTVSSQGQFTGTSSGGTGSIYGYFLVDSSGTKFYGAELFSGGPVSQPQNVILEVDVTYTALSRY
jgi:hypothetical protein